MKSIQEHVWLTSALADSEVPKALTLCFSLRQVYTSHKIAIIVSPKVSAELREGLTSAFDFVFSLDLDQNRAELKDEEFVKLYALTLTGFKSCVMLSPTMLVVSNSDELFEGNDNRAEHFVWCEGTDDGTIFKLRPSVPAFKRLMRHFRQQNGTSMLQYLKKWDTDKSGKVIPQKYNRTLNSNGILLGNQNDISIVNLANELNPGLESRFLGLIGKRVMDLWKCIQTEKVSPLLESMRNQSSLDVEISHLPINNGEVIAIVGMSCRYPGANNLEEFWNILANGQDATGNPPEFRWLKEQCSRNCKPEHRKTNAGFLKCSVDDFDSKFFGISPKEMVSMDPQHRLLHELVWEGLEDAAVDPHSLEGTNGGVFIGSWTNEYKDILSHGGNNEFYRMYMGNSIGAAAARISHLLGMIGPSIATESGCSSAMVAVHLACKSLETRETNLVLACGVNLLLNPFDKDLMPMVVSPDGHCKTFDASANGFARAEGCGVLVLKRLSDAVRDGDRIWGLIRGSGMTQEGISKSMGTPTVHCESLAMELALQDAGVDPKDVSYVEAHGTGTVVGDPLEVAAIAKAYHSDKRTEPLVIGSVKTNVGHTESCSGITGIMKVLLAMQHEIIPPQRNFETLNPAIDLDAVPAKIPLKPVQWKRQHGKPRLAGVSSFGITGTDAHVIIEESPALPVNALASKEFKRPLHIFKVTAKTDEAIDILLQYYREDLARNDNDFKNFAYTSNIGRANFSQGAIIIAKTKEDAIQNIDQNNFFRGEVAQETIGKVCFLFTGQGSQYPGMAKNLYETSPVFRMHFEYCEKILKNNYNIDITQVLWSEAKSAEVSRTIYSQTSIFCVEYALLKLWESWGVKADYALGHSLGEFAAAVCSGILNVEDAIKLVAERSRLIDDLPRGKMLVIKADKKQVDSVMKKFAANDASKVLDYAAINSSDQTVVAGDSQLILQFAESCKKSNLKCIVLEATHAFHSKHMDPMLDEYRKVAQSVTKPEKNNCKYISGMKGATIEPEQVDAEYWVEHTRQKVLFMDASKKAVELGCKTFIEIGPQPFLAALTMMNNDAQLTCLPSLKKSENEWETLLTTLGKLYVKGLYIDWKGFEGFYERKKVSLPHYPFIGKKFWPDFLSVTGSTIHPLVGSVVPNASSTKIFQNGLNLAAVRYVKDHAIGDNVIFPGAGYLEMCLAAGLATIEGSTDSLSTPTRAMKIENLSIQAPLVLNDEKTCQVQTVVDYNTSQENEMDWNDLSIKIFHKLDSERTKWLPHAQATFSPLPSAKEKEVSFCPKIFQQTLQTPSNAEIVTEIYDKLASVGLKFGPTFRSIEKLWRDEDSKSLLAKVKIPSLELPSTRYIIHPVVLDAMIQAVMMLRHTSNIKRKLYVPIKIGKFVWLSGADSSELYIHVFSSNSEGTPNDSAILVDSSGKAIALMSSLEFIDTTVKAIASVLQQQTNSLPQMWENVWRPSQNYVETVAVHSQSTPRFYSDEFMKDMEVNFNHMTAAEAQSFHELNELAYLTFLRALFELGWDPILNQRFDEHTLLTELNIRVEFRKYFRFMLEIICEEGILKQISKAKNYTGVLWEVVKLPPKLPSVLLTLSCPALSSNLVDKFPAILLYFKFGENLSRILRGAQSALAVLFPEEQKGMPSMHNFYTDWNNGFRLLEFGRRVTRQLFSKEESGPLIRILEIGAGTGTYSEGLLRNCEEFGINYEYTFTDISVSFFGAAEKRFEKYGKRIKFKRLNIEEDPIEQGFSPQSFHYVYIAEVIHATRDIRESLQNVRMLMKPFGKLVLAEQTKVNRFITSFFGSLEGFWRFEDFKLRPNHCTLSKEKWVEVLTNVGFEVEGIFLAFDNGSSYICSWKTPSPSQQGKGIKTWVLFQKNNSPVSRFLLEKIKEVENRRVVVVREAPYFEISEHFCKLRRDHQEDYMELFGTLKQRGFQLEGILYCWALNKEKVTQEELLQPLFYLTKGFISLKLRIQPRLISFTSSAMSLDSDSEPSHFHSSTLSAFTTVLKNEHDDIRCRVVEVGVAADSLEESRDKLEAIYHEIWSSDKEIHVCYQGTSRYVPRFQPHHPKICALELPKGTDRFQLILPATKTINDLTFGPLECGILKEDEVEVQIKVSALNFRDVLSVIKPTEQFKNINAVGLDFIGVVKRVGAKVTNWKVGDPVCGCNRENRALPSHVHLSEDILIPLSPNITLCEAATIPTVYMTSIVCLLEVAKIRKEDFVLIHTASGGVGLSAIEICKQVGCTILATAGSKRKQNYLRSIGIQHIFHSRNTQFGDQILELTNGRGVDVVLNSLTSEGFKEATLKACAKGARFVEMSKLNIWTTKEVNELRSDVEYSIVDLSTLPLKEFSRLSMKLNSLIEKGTVKPIPFVRFDALDIRNALSYLQKAKHIGKIVCTMPELQTKDGEIKIFTPMFSDRSSYLITGGLGGIGFEVCKWIVEMGGKHVILASRSPPSTSMQNRIKEMNSSGANVISVQLDVSKFDECRELIQYTIGDLQLPPLKGIMHAAGVLRDCSIESHDWNSVSYTFGPKIDGTLNLHKLTKYLSLEHFVTFSSSAALVGSPGQCNHAAANMFQDSLMHYRYSIGLPGTTINWGQWGEVGIATELDVPGLQTISNLQGIKGLEYAMKSQRTQTAIANFEFVLLNKIIPSLRTYLDERVFKKIVKTSNFSGSIKSDEFWQCWDSQSDPIERVNFLREQIRVILRVTLKLDDADSIGDDADFQEMGVDSLMFVEIKNGLQTLLGDRFTVNSSTLKDCNTVSLLATTIVGLIEGTNVDDTDEKPTNEQVNALIREDCQLPEHIRAKPDQMGVQLRDVSRVLLTGCTGTLGPHILKELTALSQITQVFCLMRPKKNESAEQRLQKVLDKNGISSKVNLNKVTLVSGDVTLPQLGMSSDTWNNLKGCVDAVFNCSAYVSHTELYRKKEIGSRVVNIGGMNNLLKFACEEKLKFFWHASSLFAVNKRDEDEKLFEDWPTISDYDNVTKFAYPVSKFVCDYLAKEAAERGIPVKAIRFPFITGDEKTGCTNPETNHALLRYVFVMKSGCMPSTPFPMNALPVDICADAFIRLAFDERAPTGVYNVGHANPAVDQEFVDVAKPFGRQVEIVELLEFLQRVKEDQGENKALEHFKDFYSDEDAVVSALFAASSLLECEDISTAFKSKKVETLMPSFYENLLPAMEYIYRDLKFLKEKGLFEKFGL